MPRTTKTNAPEIQPSTATASEAVNVKTEEKKLVKKYEATDLIPCRSTTQGELLLSGKKSDILYRWSAYSDVTNVEYQDLYSLKASRSDYIYKPLFVIEDEELLGNPMWNDLALLYERLYQNEDMSAFLNLPLAQFKQALIAAPEGYRQALCIEAVTQIESGSFDSMNKIKAIDEICGTDLKSMFA